MKQGVGFATHPPEARAALAASLAAAGLEKAEEAPMPLPARNLRPGEQRLVWQVQELARASGYQNKTALALACGLHHNVVGPFWDGTAERPSVESLARLCWLLDADIAPPRSGAPAGGRYLAHWVPVDSPVIERVP